MMQVSTLYAHSLERQLVSKRNQLLQNISRTCAIDQQSRQMATCTHGRVSQGVPADNPVDVDPKEFTDRLCKLPSQCKGGFVMGVPRRHSLSHSSHSLLTGSPSLMKSNVKKDSTGCSDKKAKKGKKEAKKVPSNFMFLGPWSTRQNCEKLLDQVQTGDVLEFNIKLHHHWGIAMIPKCKKTNLDNIEIIHLYTDKNDSQRAIKQTLGEYWPAGVTARINNSRDVHKAPHSSPDVAAVALKLVSQPYRVWQNSEQMINHCRYGEAGRTRQMSDAARWGTLNKCVGLWLSLTSSTRSSPSGSPSSRRKRTSSVSF